MSKVNSVINVPCTLSGNFFNCWLTFLNPIHKLTPGVVNIAANLLKHRYILSKSITDDSILDKYLLTNEEIRDQIITDCGISLSNYHVSTGKLKKAGFLIDGRINPKFIPKIPQGSDSFNLMIMFNLKDAEG